MAVPRGFRRAFKGFVDPSDLSLPEKPSERHDYDIVLVPPTFDWRDKAVLSPVRFQGNCNTCTSFAAAAVVEAVHLIEANEKWSLAPSFIHRCLLQRECSIGATAREVLGAVSTHGIASAFANDDPFPLARCNEAERISIKGWAWEPDVSRILSHITNVGPVLADMFIGQDFLSLQPNAIYTAPSITDLVLHSVAIVGFDKVANWVLVQNSFGPSWCKGGFGRVAIGSGKLLSGRGAYLISA